jgi:hypothetical protein
MASTLLGGLARVHQGGDRRGGEGGEGAYEGKSDDGFEACHGEVADRKRAGTGVGRVVAGVVWQSSSARHTTRGSRGRRFGGAMVAKQSLGSFGPYRRRLAMSFHHYIHTFTRLCLSCIAISRGPSPSHHSSISIAALATSHPSHVPQQLRQRFGHLVRASLIRHLSASAKPVPLQLAARPYLPGRIRPRSRQARFRRRWHCQQDSCRPRRSQGPPPNTALCAMPTTDSIINSETPKSSHPTKRRSSPSTRTTASPSPVSPRMPASSATS